MSGRTIGFVWCGWRRFGLGVWNAPRGATVYELGPLEIIVKPRGYAG